MVCSYRPENLLMISTISSALLPGVIMVADIVLFGKGPHSHLFTFVVYMFVQNLIIRIEIQILLHISAVAAVLVILRTFLRHILILIYQSHFIRHSIQLNFHLIDIIINLFWLRLLVIVHLVNFFNHLFLVRLLKEFLLILFIFVHLLEQEYFLA